MLKPRLKTAIAPYGHTQPLIDRTVTPRTFEFDFEEVSPIIQAFRRMVRGREFDLCEMAITTYICARAHGKRFTAVPAFFVRQFPHDGIVYNTKSGIRNPKELEGKRVGVHRGYTVTNGLWARSVLQDEYGVDLSRITWVLSGDEHVAEYQPPPNVMPIEKGRKMEDLLISGDVVAAIGVSVDSPDVQPLIPNPKEAAIASLKTRGFWPINHAVVVKDELLEAHPGLAEDVFNAFAEAKRLYIPRLRDGLIQEPSARDRTYRQVLDLTGDPLPYGIEPNRPTLEAVLRHCVTQGIISKPFTIDELFAKGTHHLTA